MNAERTMQDRRRRGRWVVAFAALAGAGLAVSGVTPATAASVTVTAGSGSGAKDTEVKIPVTLQGGPAIGAIEAVLTYDPAVLEPAGVDRGAAAANAQVESKGESGRLAMALISSEGVKGDGEVLVARFRVVGEKGATSALKLADTTVWEAEGDGFVVQVAVADGTFTVTGKKAGFPIWIIGMIAVAVLALLALLLSRRRKGTPPPTPPTPPTAVPVGTPVGPPTAPPSAVASAPAPAPTPGPASAPPEVTAAGFCPSCGTPRKAGSHYCAKCGNRME